MMTVMSSDEIVTQLAKDKVIENLVFKFGTNELYHNKQDLIQDMYYYLLTIPEYKLLNMYYTDNELIKYLTTAIKNNIFSKNSRYYYKYKKDVFDGDNEEDRSTNESSVSFEELFKQSIRLPATEHDDRFDMGG